MKTSIACLMAASMILTFSLTLSLTTNNSRWFLVGYPIAVVLTGLGDINRRRGRVATIIGGAMCVATAAVLVYVRLVQHR